LKIPKELTIVSILFLAAPFSNVYLINYYFFVILDWL